LKLESVRQKLVAIADHAAGGLNQIVDQPPLALIDVLIAEDALFARIPYPDAFAAVDLTTTRLARRVVLTIDEAFS
jgi:hypothetical protein